MPPSRNCVTPHIIYWTNLREHQPHRQPALRLRLKLASSTHCVMQNFCMRFSPGQASSPRTRQSGWHVAVGVATGNTRVGLGVGCFMGDRVGFLVGGRDGVVIGTGVGLGVWTPLTMANDTRYAVSTRPLTVPETAWAPTRRFRHGLYDRPPHRV
jgi:hypothetical protein